MLDLVKCRLMEHQNLQSSKTSDQLWNIPLKEYCRILIKYHTVGNIDDEFKPGSALLNQPPKPDPRYEIPYGGFKSSFSVIKETSWVLEAETLFEEKINLLCCRGSSTVYELSSYSPNYYWNPLHFTEVRTHTHTLAAEIFIFKCSEMIKAAWVNNGRNTTLNLFPC